MTDLIDCPTCSAPVTPGSRFCPACGSGVATGSGRDSGRPAGRLGELRDRLAQVLQGRYVILSVLGQGGMAAVFLAEDLALERRVAIKVLPPEMADDEQLVARFEREAKTAARLDHPHIIPIYRVDSVEDLHYFVMKYVAGQSLDEILVEEPRLPIDLSRRILAEASEALGHAHARHIVHRDIKPANIMLDESGRVILTDFGISKALRNASQLTGTGAVIGTPYFMAPEQAKGLEVDGRADQYALAVVGYRMLTGELPFSHDDVHTILYKQVFETAPRVSSRRTDVPPELDAAIARALHKSPDQRFPTMEEFTGAVDKSRSAARRQSSLPRGRSASDTPTLVQAPTTPIPPDARLRVVARPRPKSRRRAWVWLALLAVVTGGATLWANRAAWLPTIVARDTASALVPLAPAPPVLLDTTQPSARTDSAPADTTAAPALSPPPAESAGAEPRRPSPPRAAQGGPARRPAEVAPPQAPVGRTAPLTVASEPWGTLYVDGVEVGPTPVADYPLAFGRHELRIEQEGYRTKRETIVVGEPNPIRRRYVLDAAPAP